MPILGQLKTTGTGSEQLLVAHGDIVISSLFACENNSGAATFHVAIVPSGQTHGDHNNIYGPAAVFGSAHATVSIVCGITLSEGDSIYVSSSAAGAVFTAFGIGT